MNSWAYLVAVLAALALGVKGQDMNMTMAPDDTDMDMNATMAPGQSDMTNMTMTSAVMNNDSDVTTTMAAAVMTSSMATPGMQQPDDNTTTTDQPPNASFNETTTTMMVNTTTTVAESTTTPSPCKVPTGRLQEIFDFTNTADFRELPANTQILVYEVMAAAEGCKMTSFITPETAERIFRMLGELPVRHVYILINYMATALQNEGVVGPS